MGMFFYDMYFIIIMIMLQGGKTHHRHADADVVNAKDYCGKVLHEANAKKFA